MAFGYGSIGSGAAKGATAGASAGIPGAVIGAGIGGIVSLLGQLKGSNAAEDAAAVQERFAREALAEQRRIREEDQLKDEEERVRDEARTEAERQDVKRSRQAAFGGFGGDLEATSEGYAPAYGLSPEQSRAILQRRNSAISARYSPSTMQDQPMNRGAGGAMANTGQPQNGTNMGGLMGNPMAAPNMPTTVGSTASAARGSSSLGSTVWLRAPTGEEMEVSIEEAPIFISQGAELIPPPVGAY